MNAKFYCEKSEKQKRSLDHTYNPLPKKTHSCYMHAYYQRVKKLGKFFPASLTQMWAALKMYRAIPMEKRTRKR